MVRHVLILPMLLLLLPAGLAAQDMRRCQRADGSVIYTDRQCEPDQSEKPADTVAAPYARSGRAAMTAPPACSRSSDDLLYNVRIAIDSHDVNLLARSYHWPGLGDSQVESVLNRLDAMVQKPLVDIRLLFAAAPARQLEIEADSGNSVESAESDADNVMYADAPPQIPYGLKVLQYASPTDTRVVGTAFGLHRYFDCWWIRY